MTTNDQARKDAMADAATLHENFNSPDLYDAGVYGGCAVQAIRQEVGGRRTANQPYIGAKRAARAAFRAVPGLRGDR